MDFQIEMSLHARGFVRVAGLDEVGRGCLAGPVAAGAVIFEASRIPEGIKDSKQLTAMQREKLAVEIEASAVAFAVAIAEVDEIDSMNILNASKLAMIRALQKLTQTADYLLIDGNFNITYPLPQMKVVRGDQISVSIAAAAILAKVYRDRLMGDLDKRYPGYLFAKNKGYGSEAHRMAIKKIGPCDIHRKSFSWSPV